MTDCNHRYLFAREEIVTYADRTQDKFWIFYCEYCLDLKAKNITVFIDRLEGDV